MVGRCLGPMVAVQQANQADRLGLSYLHRNEAGGGRAWLCTSRALDAPPVAGIDNALAGSLLSKVLGELRQVRFLGSSFRTAMLTAPVGPRSLTSLVEGKKQISQRRSPERRGEETSPAERRAPN